MTCMFGLKYGGNNGKKNPAFNQKAPASNENPSRVVCESSFKLCFRLSSEGFTFKSLLTGVNQRHWEYEQRTRIEQDA